MKRSPSIRLAFALGTPVLLVVLAMGACFARDKHTISKARPPASVRTLDDLLAWRKEGITASGTFSSGGVTYTVMLGKPARSLASGPAAYVFDAGGGYVDWTSDMGDFYTEKHGFDLTSGNVKNIKRVTP